MIEIHKQHKICCKNKQTCLYFYITKITFSLNLAKNTQKM